MAHPLKADSESAHSAKLHRMTRHYGAAGPDNIKSPQEYLKGNGGEEVVGYGANSEMASARSDRPARRSTAANPVPTYARGGRVKNKGATHVNVIVAPQAPSQPQGMPGLPPQLAGAMPKPPMGMPPGPPPGPMPPSAGGPPPGGPPMMMRKRGGRTNHPDEAEDKKLIHKVLKSEGLERADGGKVPMPKPRPAGVEPQPKDLYSPDDVKRLERADGGRVPSTASMDAGAMSGEGRLEKIKMQKRNLPKPQEV